MSRQWADASLDVADDEAHQLLEEWAAWAREPMGGFGNSGLEGYMREKLDHAHDSAEMTPRIERAEKALAMVKAQNRIWLKVIKKYYLARRGPAEIASELRMTHGYVRDLLKSGKNCFWSYYLEIKG